MLRRSLATLAVTALLAAAPAAAFARNGADDPAGHERHSTTETHHRSGQGAAREAAREAGHQHRGHHRHSGQHPGQHGGQHRENEARHGNDDGPRHT
jgi:hypothetical protein